MSTMTDEMWGSAWELFNEANQLPPERRRSFVEGASAHPEITKRVLELLEEVPPAEYSRVGTTFGRYRILRKLGRGGMGEVYSAEDTQLGRTVALKFLSAEAYGSPQAVRRFIREAKAASALNHPNIITVYDVVESESAQAIAMELVDGQSLREYCKEANPADRVASWGRQIAQALAAAHGRGIVHRDIKPENLMARSDGYIKVLDFGLARQVRLEGAAGSTNFSEVLGGTLNYMSPEQTRGEPATGASDVFSLGMVLFELVTGKHPFLGDSPLDTAHAIAHNAPRNASRFNALMPPIMAETIAAMLAKGPAERPPAKEVEERLASLAVDSKKIRKARYRLAALTLVACVAGGWGVWTLQRWLSAPKEPVMRQITMQRGENRVTAAALSPDGKMLAIANLGEQVQLRQMSDGFSRSLPTPEGLRVNQIAWFADASKLLASGFSERDAQPAIWIIPVTGGKPTLVIAGGENGVPSPDGTRIALTAADGATISVMELKTGKLRQIRGGGGTAWFSVLLWSPDGKRISYQRRDYASPRDRQVQGKESWIEYNYSYRYESADADTGQIVASVKDISMTSASGLPDGRVLFVSPIRIVDVYFSHVHVWELATDPQTGRILDAPRRLTGSKPLPPFSQMSVTADGKQFVAVQNADERNIYVADVLQGDSVPKLMNSRRLTLTLAFEFPHAWTPDSRAVIFESNRNGRNDLFRQDIDRKEAQPIVVSPRDKVLAQVSPDGRWILYREDQKDRPAGVLMRVPIDGGQPNEIPTGGRMGEFRCGLQTGSRCVLRLVENDQFFFYDLDPVRGLGQELARTVWSTTILGDWDISPNGLLVAIPNHEPHSAKIRLVQLDESSAGLAEKVVNIEGLKSLHGLVWAADGRGWYVCAGRPVGWLLSYVDLQGRSSPLLSMMSSTFAVPSRDGRRLAFPGNVGTSNVWLIESFR